MELFQASAQYSSRPADERYPDVESAILAARALRHCSVRKAIDVGNLTAVPDGRDVALSHNGGAAVPMTNWAFGQVCAKAQAPAAYLGTLPADLASQALTYGLAKVERSQGSALLAKSSSGLWRLRALNGEGYGAIWNVDVLERVGELISRGWRQPTPTFNTYGSEVAPYPIMMGDRDLFAFVVKDDVRIPEPGNPEGLARGVFVRNSEVGAAYLELTAFLYRAICGNFIVWGADKVTRVRVRHVGERAARRWPYMFEVEARRVLDQSAERDAARVVAAQRFILGSTKENVLDKLFGLKVASRQALSTAYDAVDRDQDGDPRSAWGFAQGMTRASQAGQARQYADSRATLDAAAARVLNLAARAA